MSDTLEQVRERKAKLLAWIEYLEDEDGNTKPPEPLWKDIGKSAVAWELYVLHETLDVLAAAEQELMNPSAFAWLLSGLRGLKIGRDELVLEAITSLHALAEEQGDE